MGCTSLPMETAIFLGAAVARRSEASLLLEFAFCCGTYWKFGAAFPGLMVILL